MGTLALEVIMKASLFVMIDCDQSEWDGVCAAEQAIAILCGDFSTRLIALDE